VVKISKSKFWFVLFIVIICLVGCDSKTNQLKDLNLQINSLESQNIEFRKQLEVIGNNNEELSNKIILLKEKNVLLVNDNKETIDQLNNEIKNLKKENSSINYDLNYLKCDFEDKKGFLRELKKTLKSNEEQKQENLMLLFDPEFLEIGEKLAGLTVHSIKNMYGNQEVEFKGDIELTGTYSIGEMGSYFYVENFDKVIPHRVTNKNRDSLVLAMGNKDAFIKALGNNYVYKLGFSIKVKAVFSDYTNILNYGTDQTSEISFKELIYIENK